MKCLLQTGKCSTGVTQAWTRAGCHSGNVNFVELRSAGADECVRPYVSNLGA